MTKASAPRRHLPTSPFNAPTVPVVQDFTVGERVSHDRFGLGRVLEVEDGVALLVDFGSHRTRIVTPYKGTHKL
jgi:hypothetical protein